MAPPERQVSGQSSGGAACLISFLSASSRNVSAMSRSRALSPGSATCCANLTHSAAYRRYRRRKKTATNPPRHAEVEVAFGSNGSPQFPITKLLKNKVPKIGVTFAGTEEARLQESEKFRKYAADCIRIASQMNGKDRQALLDIADAWETRAQEAEKKEKGLRC
jgi:hypothetical protein